MNNTAMYKLSYGLFVLSSTDGEKDNACIVNTVEQVTTTPNRITVAINKNNHTHDLVMKSKKFNASILSTKAEFSIFERFGFHTGKDTDKFEGLETVARSENGLLYVTEGTNAFLSGSVVETFDLGTHTLFVADVTDGEVLSNDDAATYTYYQQHIKPAPDATKKKGWRCKICGHIHEGETLPEDFVCPICKHGAIDFEKIQ